MNKMFFKSLTLIYKTYLANFANVKLCRFYLIQG